MRNIFVPAQKEERNRQAGGQTSEVGRSFTGRSNRSAAARLRRRAKQGLGASDFAQRRVYVEAIAADTQTPLGLAPPPLP